MTELSTAILADRARIDRPESPPLRLGFVHREPLDTMLKLERLPPPILSFDGPSVDGSKPSSRPLPNEANKQKLQAVKMRLDLAELVIASEDKILATGDIGVIEGLNEVHRFLVHCEHLRLLQER